MKTVKQYDIFFKGRWIQSTYEYFETERKALNFARKKYANTADIKQVTVKVIK